MPDLTQYLSEDGVRLFDDATKDDVLESLCEAVCTGSTLDVRRVQKAILGREALLSTGIGLGIALPHVRLEAVERFVLSIGVCKTGVDYGSMDDLPVTIVFLIVGPRDPHSAFVKFIADVTGVLKREEFRRELVEQTDAAGVRALLARQ